MFGLLRPLTVLSVDLADPMLSEPLILKFRGRVCELSKQKFSSNVIEKVRFSVVKNDKENANCFYSVSVLLSHRRKRY